MQLIGVGYRAAVSGSKLTLNLGYSNPVEFDIPNGLSCKVRPALCCASFLIAGDIGVAPPPNAWCTVAVLNIVLVAAT